MKLRNIFGVLAASVALMLTGCSENYEVDNLKGLTVSSSYVSLPENGGSNTISISANDAWQLDTTGTVTKDGAWLQFSTLNGSAGQSELTINAGAYDDRRTATIKLISGGQTQYINIIQGDVAAPQVISVAQAVSMIKAGTQGTKSYLVKGVVCRIQEISTQYGNATYWLSDDGNYVGDNAHEIQVYRGMWLNGAKFTDANAFSVGDKMTVSAVLIDYQGIPETKSGACNVVSLEKSLIKCDSIYVDGVKDGVIPAKGGDATAFITLKGGDGLHVTVPEDAQSWLSIKAINGNEVVFHANANNAGARSTTLTFTTTKDNVEYKTTGVINQDGSAGSKGLPFTVSEAISYIKSLGDATSPTQVYIKGTVSEIAKGGEFGTKYGNGSFFISEDGTYSGSNDKDFEAYHVLWLGNKKWAEGNAQIAPGAEVVICATVKSYKGVPETASGYVYSVNGVTTDANGIGTLDAPFNPTGAVEAANAGVKAGVYVSGKITSIAKNGTFSAQYGNATFFMDKFEAYRVLYLGNRKWDEGDTQIKEGDDVTIFGPLTVYNGTAETQGNKGYIVNLNGKTAAKRRR